ncbi:ABC transporter permease [Gorillibacterium massiliense]|uniref:ABC transporter permease n=1 Tax=Gorillibacterium massiliense TaxID=1280390 RepID=UPI0004B23082|nr:ABC transporter permease subunit [Gorillibacterium massiliense]
MKTWLVLFGKELMEMRRNFKMLWVPIVFLLLGIMQPVTTYFLPEIIKASGDMPESFTFPTPTAADVMVKTLGNFGQVGLLILALAVMSALSGERASGMAANLLVKPISRTSYILSKWAAAVVLAWSSFLLGMIGAWYYTVQLVSTISFANVILGSLIYGLWITVVVTATLLMSGILRSGAAAAGVSLLFAIVLSVVSSSLPRFMKWSPSQLTSHAYSFINEGHVGAHVTLPLVTAILFIVVLLAGTVAVLRRKEPVAS